MEGMEAARTPPAANASSAASAHSSAVLEGVFSIDILAGIDYTRTSGYISPYRTVWHRAGNSEVPVFVTLLAVTFLIAAAVTTIVGRVFQQSIVRLANRGTEAAA